MLPVLAEAETAPELHQPLIYGAVTIVSALGTALVVLYFRWRKGNLELEKIRNELAAAKEASSIANQQAAAEVRQTVTKTDMEVHEQVVTHLTKMIDGYESRFSAFVKQAEEREIQFQEMMDASRREHLECVRKYERAEARIEMLEAKNTQHEHTIEQLNQRIETLQHRRR